jgi:hypothetical protein
MKYSYKQRSFKLKIIIGKAYICLPQSKLLTDRATLELTTARVE